MNIATQPKTNPPPNFFVTNSVIVDAPWQTAYRTFGTNLGHERVCRLSTLCTRVEMHEKDTVHLPMPEYPDGKSLEDVALRTIANPNSGPEASSSPAAAGKGLAITRQHFLVDETVPLLFGLFKTKVALTGTLSWDSALLTEDGVAPLPPPTTPILALYESRAHNGLEVWKLRTFEPLPDNKTKITERIEGWAPFVIRRLVEREAQKAHRAQLDLYPTLL